MVLNTEDYKQKIHNVLDTGTYKSLLGETMTSMTLDFCLQVIVALKTDQRVNRSSLSEKVKRAVRCTEAV